MKYILYGAGAVGLNLLRNIGSNKVAFFCDGKKHGEKLEGIEIIAPEKLIEIYKEYIVVIAVEKSEAVKQITRWLENNKISWISVLEALKNEGIDTDNVKHDAELGYWKKSFGANDRNTIDQYYRELIMNIGDMKDDIFWNDIIVADFGCGPRGSLTWIKNARERIGIDVIAKEYLNEFGQNMISHNMIYVASNEKFIPIPSGYVDCLVTINSLDHVSDLRTMCSEIRRILKPDGMLLGSFNLFEPATECEPQTLTENNLRELLLFDFEIDEYRLSEVNEKDAYMNAKNRKYVEKPDGSVPCVLWVKGRKKIDI